MSKPKVSVLMPVYNSARYLVDAIDSILEQSFTDFELIIIDDGSTDNSCEILMTYEKKDARIQLVSRENKGISVTRNQLVALAKGKYIAWMDSDDISHQQRLEKQVNYLDQNKTCVAVGCMTEFIDDQGLKICEWNIPTIHYEIDGWHIIGKGGAIIFPSSMMRKGSLNKSGNFNEQLTGAEDLCLFLSLAEIGNIENINEVLYIYRQHLDSISHAAKLKILQDTQRVVDEARKRRGMAAYICTFERKEISRQAIYTKWGWWALTGNNLVAARKYAKKSVLADPFKWQAWKLLACSIRGY